MVVCIFIVLVVSSSELSAVVASSFQLIHVESGLLVSYYKREALYLFLFFALPGPPHVGRPPYAKKYVSDRVFNSFLQDKAGRSFTYISLEPSGSLMLHVM